MSILKSILSIARSLNLSGQASNNLISMLLEKNKCGYVAYLLMSLIALFQTTWKLEDTDKLFGRCAEWDTMFRLYVSLIRRNIELRKTALFFFVYSYSIILFHLFMLSAAFNYE